MGSIFHYYYCYADTVRRGIKGMKVDEERVIDLNKNPTRKYRAALFYVADMAGWKFKTRSRDLDGEVWIKRIK